MSNKRAHNLDMFLWNNLVQELSLTPIQEKQHWLWTYASMYRDPVSGYQSTCSSHWYRRRWTRCSSLRVYMQFPHQGSRLSGHSPD